MATSPITSWEIDGETVETVSDFIFWSSKITVDGDCSREIKRHLLLGSKVMTNLDSILKSRDITWPTNVHLVKAMEKVMAPHTTTLAWNIPWTEGPGRLQSMGSRRVRHNWATSISLFTFHFHALEKKVATHSSVLAWRIPGMQEPGGVAQSRTRLKRLSSSSRFSSVQR